MIIDKNTTKKILIIIFILVLLLVNYINILSYNTTNYLLSNIKESNQILTEQICEMTEKLCEITDLYENKFLDINKEIYNLYEMHKLHDKCMALALQLNEDIVLAEQYDRTLEEQEKLYSDDDLYSSYYGRLYIPDAKMDVALYNGYEQYITDRHDSANIFVWSTYSGQTIADHNSQAFSKLFSVEVGTQGYIHLANGDIINIECVDVFNGYNIGRDAIDENGVSAMGRNDYMMYTCRNGWQNIRICLWDII